VWKNALTAMAIHLGEKSAPSAVDERFMWIKKKIWMMMDVEVTLLYVVLFL